MKIIKLVGLVTVVAAVMYIGSVVKDRQTLNEEIIRLHVVADSNSEADQAVKLKVRDAVITTLEEAMADSESKDEAQGRLQEQLDELEDVANSVLKAEGVGERAIVSLMEEEFPTRVYDTFTLPAGVYDSLRITIGSGEGKNWWCVVFPSLCVPAASEGVTDMAVSAGFSDSLSQSLTGNDAYEVRFFLLDCMGWVENFFHKG